MKMLGNVNMSKPIIQAPMAGVTSPTFVAACCEAGVLGFIGAGYLNGEETQTFIKKEKKFIIFAFNCMYNKFRSG